MSLFAGDLAPTQVFSGKTDPVSIIRNATPDTIAASVRTCHADGRGRVIVSAGCEIPPDTSAANLRALTSDLMPPLAELQ